MATFPIVNAFARYWWVLLIRGIIAVLFAIMAFTLPGRTLLTLVLLYGIYALGDGLMAIWVGASARAWGFVLLGILDVLAALYAFFYPGLTAVLLLYFIAGWSIVKGIFEIVTARQLRQEINNEWMLIVGGVISIIFGLVLFSNPASVALVMIWLIGLYALVFGLVMIVLALRLRGLPHRLETRSGEAL